MTEGGKEQESKGYWQVIHIIFITLEDACLKKVSN